MVKIVHTGHSYSSTPEDRTLFPEFYQLRLQHNFYLKINSNKLISNRRKGFYLVPWRWPPSHQEVREEGVNPQVPRRRIPITGPGERTTTTTTTKSSSTGSSAPSATSIWGSAKRCENIAGSASDPAIFMETLSAGIQAVVLGIAITMISNFTGADTILELNNQPPWPTHRKYLSSWSSRPILDFSFSSYFHFLFLKI